MKHQLISSLLLVIALSGCAAGAARPEAKPDLAALQRQVADTERAFAATMARRDHAGFASFLSEETVFFSSKGALRGKATVVEAWKGFYEGPQAPFSWEPAEVEVLDSGTLAISAGPVYDPSGKKVSLFNSIWRLEGGQWRIIFDRGGCLCSQK